MAVPLASRSARPEQQAKCIAGTPITFALFDRAVHTVRERLPRHGMPGEQCVDQAAWMLAELTHAKQLAEFLTVPAYELLP